MTALFSKTIGVVFALGICCGLPYSLTSATLALWLNAQGVSLETIGLTAFITLPYTLRILWAPMIDHYKLPFLYHALGRRKSYIMLMQLGLTLAMGLLTFAASSGNNFLLICISCVLIAFFSASQDVVGDAYRVEIVPQEQQAKHVTAYMIGYKVGYTLSSGGILFIAAHASWEKAFLSITILMLLCGICMFFCIHEPKDPAVLQKENKKINIKKMLKETIIDPFLDFMQHKNWPYIVLFLAFFKLCDAFTANLNTVFFSQIGFTELQIAQVNSVYGFGLGILGTIVGSIILHKYGLMKSLWISGGTQILVSVMYIIHATKGNDYNWFVLTIFVDNINSAFGGLVIIDYIGSLCGKSKKFTATQFALLISLSFLSKAFFAPSAGYIVSLLGWFNYYNFVGIMVLQGFIFLYLLSKKTKIPESPKG